MPRSASRRRRSAQRRLQVVDSQVALLAVLDVVLADLEGGAAPGLNLHPVAAAGEGTQAEGSVLAAEDLAEERRLFFVGMTRARSRLLLTCARHRLWRGKVRSLDPSPFLRDVEERLLDRKRHEPVGKPRSPYKQLTLFDGG